MLIFLNSSFFSPTFKPISLKFPTPLPQNISNLSQTDSKGEEELKISKYKHKLWPFKSFLSLEDVFDCY